MTKSNDANLFRVKAWQVRLLLIAVVALFVGCQGKQPAQLNTQYGKISGSQGVSSLNGVSVFADMFAQRGYKVKRRTKISPRIYQYDTIVWCPDSYSCPSEEAVLALNDWLFSGNNRTLIYVGRNYETRTDYLTAVKDSSPIDQREEFLRQIAEAKIDQDNDDDQFEFDWLYSKLTSCEWFEQVETDRAKANTITNQNGETILANIEISTLLQPISDDPMWDSETWIEADGQPFASKLTDDYYGNGSIFVISNGSFLLNYALIDSEHRRMATALIDETNPTGNVIFLESGPREIMVSESDTTNHNQWAWISRAPLRYIVPHFLMWGLLFCFVFFPVFGRPRRVKAKSTSDFRSHINATSKLLERDGHQNQALQTIRDYQKLVGSESKRKTNND
ncbi:MAG: hypothetical protein ACI87E_002027 [Mariniblastus sp.]|jgi:hypothetical protein